MRVVNGHVAGTQATKVGSSRRKAISMASVRGRHRVEVLLGRRVPGPVAACALAPALAERAERVEAVERLEAPRAPLQLARDGRRRRD